MTDDTEYKGRPFEKTANAVEAWGIDPTSIFCENVTPEGYWRFVWKDAPGAEAKKLAWYSDAGNADSAVKEFVLWPEGAGKTIYDIWLSEYVKAYE